MYKDYYRLKNEPFGTHPNTGTFFISHTHKEAWNYLLSGIESREPFLLLTGEYGMGKTLLCFRLMKYLQEKGTTRVEYIPSSNEGYGGILRRMATNLGMSPLPEDEEILQDMIYDRFRAESEKSLFYLIIDDVHELDTTTLISLKHLSNFNHDEFFPVILIFVGHPSFLKDLRTSALRSLNQRIKRRYHLTRFSLEDTKNYIYFRLLKSGATGVPAFPDETVKKIFEFSGGVPRLIHNICDTCLLIAASQHLISIPPAVVDDAKKMVEASLTGAESEAGTDSDAMAVTRVAATIFKELSADGATGRGSALSTRPEREERGPEIARPRVSLFDKRMKTTVAIVAVAIVLVSVALLARLFMNNDKIVTFLSPLTWTVQQKTQAQPEKAAIDIQSPREEPTDQPYHQAPISTGRMESLTSVPAEPLPKQVTGINAPPSLKEETLSTGSSKPFAFHPFSLRASSYQQQERAFEEISEIKQRGLTPYLVKADVGDLGTLWRIYIGFYSTEEEAKKIKTTYKLVNASVQKTDYSCQVGEFSSEKDILIMFEKLKQAGYFPYAIQKDRNRFRLYIGAYEKKAEAEVLRQELDKKAINSQVVKR
jgi:type II secretory pathway predicted ATPase ExeA/cell division septation protein DedD